MSDVWSGYALRPRSFYGLEDSQFPAFFLSLAAEFGTFSQMKHKSLITDPLLHHITQNDHGAVTLSSFSKAGLQIEPR
jgi:acid stress-induced BolA-like protein IbaG/YrbA